MKKEFTAVSTAIGVVVSSVIAEDVVSYKQGNVSDSRYLLASADGMTCGKEMKEKVKECKKMMKEATCGEKMKECKTLLQKVKDNDSSCGAMMKKSKEKAKEMTCGKCGAMK